MRLCMHGTGRLGGGCRLRAGSLLRFVFSDRSWWRILGGTCIVCYALFVNCSGSTRRGTIADVVNLHWPFRRLVSPRQIEQGSFPDCGWDDSGGWFGKIVTAVSILIRDDDPWFNPPSSHRPFFNLIYISQTTNYLKFMGTSSARSSRQAAFTVQRKCTDASLASVPGCACHVSPLLHPASPQSPRACARISDNHFQTLTDTFSISAVANSYVELHKQAV